MDACLRRTSVHRPSFIVPMLDGLESLLRKNLLRDEEQPDDEPRFRMLETIREFAAECLAESGEEDAVRRTAADYYLDFVEGSQQELTGPNQVIWLQRIDREHDNLRAVLN